MQIVNKLLMPKTSTGELTTIIDQYKIICVICVEVTVPKEPL